MSKHQQSSQVTVALVTPPGSGGIAVIEVRGRGAGRVVNTIFVPKSGADWRAAPMGTLHYGHVRDGREVVDEVIVRRSPSSSECVEVNCHGGIVAASEVLRLLVTAGAVEVRGAAVAEGAAEGLGLDGAQAAALRLLPLAETRLAARVVCDQLDGAFSAALRALDPAGAEGRTALRALLESAEFGRSLTRPRRLALIGRPNVGKSTLFNALVGHHRTIVSSVPGTTRDFVNECIVIGGYPVEVIDTAGLRLRGDVVEMKGVEAAWRVASDADLILLVIDASAGVSVEERAVADALRPKGLLVAANKIDRAGAAVCVGEELGREVCRLSALKGEGLDALERAIFRWFPDPACYPPGSPVVLTDEQADGLRRALDRSAAGDTEGARAELLRLMQ